MIYAGQSVKPFESRRFVTGSGSFVADLTFPDMLHVVVLRSLHAHTKLKAIQASAACARPGVMAVLTAAAQLFNLSEDLGEADDLAGEEAERAASMLTAYEEWRAEIDATATEQPALPSD